MKLVGLTAALLVASASATQCTLEQVTTVKSTPEYEASMAAGCGVSLMAEVTTCEANPCRKPLEALLKVMPDCTIDGVAFKEEVLSALADIDQNCKSGGATAPASTTGTPSATTDTGGSPSLWSTTKCSSAQIEQYKASKFESVVLPTCGPLDTMVKPAGLPQTCSEPCLSAWEESLKLQVDCTIAGNNMKKMLTEAFAVIQERCPAVRGTASTASPSLTDGSSNGTTPTVSSSNATSPSSANSTSTSTLAPATPSSGSSAVSVSAALAATVTVGVMAA